MSTERRNRSAITPPVALRPCEHPSESYRTHTQDAEHRQRCVLIDIRWWQVATSCPDCTDGMVTTPGFAGPCERCEGRRSPKPPPPKEMPATGEIRGHP